MSRKWNGIIVAKTKIFLQIPIRPPPPPPPTWPSFSSSVYPYGKVGLLHKLVYLIFIILLDVTARFNFLDNMNQLVVRLACYIKEM